jgi:hypothetical protein
MVILDMAIYTAIGLELRYIQTHGEVVPTRIFVESRMATLIPIRLRPDMWMLTRTLQMSGMWMLTPIRLRLGILMLTPIRLRLGILMLIPIHLQQDILTLTPIRLRLGILTLIPIRLRLGILMLIRIRLPFTGTCIQMLLNTPIHIVMRLPLI